MYFYTRLQNRRPHIIVPATETTSQRVGVSLLRPTEEGDCDTEAVLTPEPEPCAPEEALVGASCKGGALDIDVVTVYALGLHVVAPCCIKAVGAGAYSSLPGTNVTIEGVESDRVATTVRSYNE